MLARIKDGVTVEGVRYGPIAASLDGEGDPTKGPAKSNVWITVAPAMLSLARQGWLKPGALVCVETDAGEILPEVEALTLLDRRATGRIAVALYQFQS